MNKTCQVLVSAGKTKIDRMECYCIGRLTIRWDYPISAKVILWLHDTQFAGHLDSDWTLKILKRDFYWTLGAIKVKRYVEAWSVCVFLFALHFVNRPYEMIDVYIERLLSTTARGYRFSNLRRSFHLLCRGGRDNRWNFCNKIRRTPWSTGVIVL